MCGSAVGASASKDGHTSRCRLKVISWSTPINCWFDIVLSVILQCRKHMVWQPINIQQILFCITFGWALSSSLTQANSDHNPTTKHDHIMWKYISMNNDDVYFFTSCNYLSDLDEKINFSSRKVETNAVSIGSLHSTNTLHSNWLFVNQMVYQLLIDDVFLWKITNTKTKVEFIHGM